jgi:hypothetical protein
MNRGSSNGKVNSMKDRNRREWLQRVNEAASLKPGQHFKTLPLVNGKFERIPFEQIIERAKQKGITPILRDDGTALYLAVPKKAA